MANCKQLLSLVLWVFMSYVSVAQTNRYMVFFTDKANSEFSIENPGAYLTQRAIDRRTRQGISLSEEDLPVNQTYIDGVRALDIETYFTTKWLNGVLVQTEAAKVSSIEALEYVSHVELVAPDVRLTQVREPDPGQTQTQTFNPAGLSNTVQRDMVGGDVMHAEGYAGADIQIAVLDGGFRNVNNSSYFEYLFDSEQYLGGKDYVTDGNNPFQYSTHGTGALSTIVGDAGSAFRGLAYQSSVLLLVTEDVASEYRIEEYNWLFGAEYADSLGIDIISTSLGYTNFDDPSMDYTNSDLDGETAVVTRAAEMAYTKGMLVVTSAGNSGDKSWRFVSTPADGANVLAVGAVNDARDRAEFSSVGPTADGRIKPDVVAMGRSTVLFQTNFGTSSGTSFSAPIITAFAAGLWQSNPDWNNEQLLQAIKRRGSRFESPDNLIGFGIPHFELDRVLSLDQETLEWSLYPNPVATGKITLETFNAPLLEVKLFDTQGRHVPVSMHSESQKVQFELVDKESGIYFLTLLTEHGTETIRILNYPE